MTATSFNISDAKSVFQSAVQLKSMSSENVRVNRLQHLHAPSIKYIWLEQIYTGLHWIVSAHKEGLRLLIFNILAAQITCSSHRMKERESTQNTRSWAGEEKWPQEAREHLTVRESECVTQPKEERGQVRQTQADQYETNREPRLTRWIKYNISQLSTLIISDYWG